MDFPLPDKDTPMDKQAEGLKEALEAALKWCGYFAIEYAVFGSHSEVIQRRIAHIQDLLMEASQRASGLPDMIREFEP